MSEIVLGEVGRSRDWRARIRRNAGAYPNPLSPGKRSIGSQLALGLFFRIGLSEIDVGRSCRNIEEMGD